MKYGFTVDRVKVEDHEFYYVKSKCVKGCVAQGDTLEEALNLFDELEAECIETAHEYNIPIEEETAKELNEYSGKILLRMPKTLHRDFAELADSEGVSINHLAVTALSSYVGYARGQKDAMRIQEKRWVEFYRKFINLLEIPLNNKVQGYNNPAYKALRRKDMMGYVH